MALFSIPKEETVNNTTNKIKLKKGESIYTLIEQAERLVNEKLGKYKDSSRCVTDIEDLKRFFYETEDDGIIRYRYRNTGIEYFSR